MKNGGAPRRSKQEMSLSIISGSGTTIALLFIFGLVLVGCSGGGARALQSAARQIAQREGATTDEVLRALDDVARTTGTSEDDLARSWRDAPAAGVVDEFDDDLARLSGTYDLDSEIMKGVICDSIKEALRSGEFPSAEDVAEYLETNAAAGIVPGGKAAQLAESFQDAIEDIESGAEPVARGRLLLLELRYC